MLLQIRKGKKNNGYAFLVYNNFPSEEAVLGHLHPDAGTLLKSYGQIKAYTIIAKERQCINSQHWNS